jgi:hypothetical protein
MTDKPQMPPDVEADVHANAKLANELADKLAPIIIQYPAHAIGAALAALTASWLSGYRGERSKPGSEVKMRTMMFASFIRSVMQELPEIMSEVDKEETKK